MNKLLDEKYLLFDLGNVFVDWDKSPFVKAVADGIDSKTTLSINYEDNYWRSLRVSESKLDLGMINWADFCEDLTRIYSWSGCSKSLLKSFKEIFMPNFELIEWFQTNNFSETLILVSNTNKYHWDWMLESLPEFLAKFDHLHLSHLISARKPEVEYYTKLKVIKNWNKVFFCDDLADNLVIPKSFGAQVHQFEGSSGLRQDLKKFASQNL